MRAYIVMVLAMVQGCSGRPQPIANHQGESNPVFLVATISPSGSITSRRADRWAGAADEDTVIVALPRVAGRPDSVRVMAKSGPVVMLDELPDVDRADSLGEWAVVPDSLFKPGLPASDTSLVSLGGLAPRTLANWTKAQRGGHPYLTRVAVLVWVGGRLFRSEMVVGQAS